MPPNLIKHLKANTEYYQFPADSCFCFTQRVWFEQDQMKVKGSICFQLYPQKHVGLACFTFHSSYSSGQQCMSQINYTQTAPWMQYGLNKALF